MTDSFDPTDGRGPEPTAAEPPFGDRTDEAVAAVLDGELDGFARDVGLSTDEVERRLHGWGGFEAARSQQADVARALASAPIGLDDVTRRRLVRRALDEAAGAATGPGPEAAGGRGPRRWLAATAAAVVVVVGIGLFATARDRRDEAGDATRLSADSETTTTDLGDLGDVTDPAVLRAAVLDDASEAARDAPDVTTESPSSPELEEAAPGPQPEPPSGAGATSGAPDPGAARLASCIDVLASGRTPRFRATGTRAGDPVVIVGVEEADRTLVVVADASTCEIVAAQSL